MGALLSEEKYAFVMATDSPLVDRVNEAILTAVENGTLLVVRCFCLIWLPELVLAAPWLDMILFHMHSPPPSFPQAKFRPFIASGLTSSR